MRHALLVVLSSVCLLAPIHAHGGQYKGPGDAGTPAAGNGGSAGPPTNPRGGLAPGVGAPGTANGGTTASTGGPRSGTPRGPNSSTVQPAYTDSYENWEFWWEANKDSFLDLKSHLVGGENTGAISLTGQGRVTGKTVSRRPTLDVIQERVVPMLEELIRSSNERDILDSSIVALARAGSPASRSDVVPLAIGLLANKELSVQSAATLALGIARRPEAAPTLQALMAGSAEGRRLMGGNAVPTLVRAFAALSLGLLDDATSVPRLIELLDGTRDGERDLKVCAITSLGLMTPRDDSFHYLMTKLGDRKLDAIIASYVAIALGRIGRPEAVKALVGAFTSRDTDDLVRQSAAIALGQLATLGQSAAVDALVACIREGRDEQTRHFCFISLAQIGARDEGADDATTQPERRAALIKLFGDEIARPSRSDHRSWAALAAAILGRADESARAAFQPRLIEAWGHEKDPSYRSAFALALGLLRVTSMGAQLFDDYKTSNDADHRGYTALALGFLEYREAADLLRAQCSQRAQVPSYRLQVATALGLLGDTEAVTVLVTTLQNSETLGVSSAVARALGLIGDGTAIDPLRTLALNADKPAIARAFACVALGRLCETTELPWNARLAANNNYRAGVPALDEALDIQ
jgi:HEAT repeat protein